MLISPLPSLAFSPEQASTLKLAIENITANAADSNFFIGDLHGARRRANFILDRRQAECKAGSSAVVSGMAMVVFVMPSATIVPMVAAIFMVVVMHLANRIALHIARCINPVVDRIVGWPGHGLNSGLGNCSS